MTIAALAADTRVTYPSGDTTSSGTVLHVEAMPEGRAAVILDTTAFHPVDPVWPDQPADRGALILGESSYPVIDAVVGATDGESLFVGDAPVRTGTDGWVFVVCHMIADPDGSVASACADDTRGVVPARVDVDAQLRQELSAGHTACHVASLALNASLAGLWSKEAPRDGRGEPNFDQLAITESRIVPNGSLDTYRIGKSLRKKGFAAADLASALDEAAATANRLLAEWVESDASVSVVHAEEAQSREPGFGLGERRLWRCELVGGAVEIPCGGTHIRSLGELGSVSVALELEEIDNALELRMRTTAVRA